MTKRNYFSTSFMVSLCLHQLLVYIAITFLPDIKNLSKIKNLDHYSVSIVLDSNNLKQIIRKTDQKINLNVEKNILPIIPKPVPIKELFDFKNTFPILHANNKIMDKSIPKPPSLHSKEENLSYIDKPNEINKNIKENKDIKKNPIFHDNPNSQITLKAKVPSNAIEELVGFEKSRETGQCRTIYIPINYDNFKITNGNDLIKSATEENNIKQSELKLYAFQVLIPHNEIQAVYKNENNPLNDSLGNSFNAWSQNIHNYEKKVFYTRKWIYKYAKANEQQYTTATSQGMTNSQIQYSQAIVCD